MNNVLERMNNVKMCSGVQIYFANCSFVCGQVLIFQKYFYTEKWS